MIEVLLLLLVPLALVVACGGFVAAEFSLVTVDRSAVERAVERGDRGASSVLAALKSLSTQLSGAQVGITVTNLVIGYMSEPAIASLIDGPLESLGVPDGAVTGVALTIALIIATLVTMLFGELVPKNIAIAKPLDTAKRVAGFQRGFTALTRPIVTACNNSANAILKRFGIEPQEELASARSPDELSSLVRRSADVGTLERETANLLERSLEFGEHRAGDVMTPRLRAETLHPEQTALDVIEAARETGRSRFPVVDEEHEHVSGLIHLKHAVAVPYEKRAETPISKLMVEAVFVPDSIELDPLLAQLREGGMQMAIVVDEFGGVAGLVTLEDLIEEIVGEVVDEHDPRDTSSRREGEGRWSLSGLLRPDEVTDVTGIEVPEDEEYETIAGLIAMRLERLPEEGDEIEFESRDSERRPYSVKLRVLSLDDLRVDRVRMTFEEIEVPDEDDER
ncbi:HlyC/CorC family transporter [Thermoleophilia bacterium SCSIO 60948]|nr:HlyC/CorC family transporter [Thermoleophilia bacterium SCSIO 60948]